MNQVLDSFHRSSLLWSMEQLPQNLHATPLKLKTTMHRLIDYACDVTTAKETHMLSTTIDCIVLKLVLILA